MKSADGKMPPTRLAEDVPLSAANSWEARTIRRQCGSTIATGISRNDESNLHEK